MRVRQPFFANNFNEQSLIAYSQCLIPHQNCLAREPAKCPQSSARQKSPAAVISYEKEIDENCALSYFTIRLFNHMVTHTASPDHLSTTFAALADPTRRA